MVGYLTTQEVSSAWLLRSEYMEDEQSYIRFREVRTEDEGTWAGGHDSFHPVQILEKRLNAFIVCLLRASEAAFIDLCTHSLASLRR